MSKKQLLIFSGILIVLLVIRFIFVFQFQQKEELEDGDLLEFTTVISSEPKTNGNSQYFKALVSGNEVKIVLEAFPSFHYADSLKIQGAVVEKISNSNFRTLTLYYPKIEKVADFNPFLSSISFIRNRLVANFSENLPPFSSSLLLGIVFGVKDSMSKDFLEIMKTTGVMHVIAASGMNITMFAGFLSAVMISFFKRRTSLFVTIVGIVFYACLAGLQPSIIRASVMAIIVFSAQIIGRQTISYYCLFLTAFLMLFYNPHYINDVGFQLSFLSTLGILSIQPHLMFVKKIIFGEDIATTMSAQIATLPIMLFYFGTYSLWSILINALVLWVIPPLMVLGGLGAIFTFIFSPISKLFLLFSLPFLLYFEGVTRFFTALPYSIEVKNFSIFFVLGYYFILLSILIFLNKKRTNEKS